MRIFKTKWFNKWSAKEGLLNSALIMAAFFIYGYAKNQRDNIDQHELQELKLLATKLLGLTEAALTKVLEKNRLIEVRKNGG
jgi:hypothetical protein